MGIQQIFLLIISIIVILIAVYAGITIMKSYSESSNREQLISSLYDIGLDAQKYFKRIMILRGKNTFAGWELSSANHKTEAGTFIASVQPERIVISANGTQTGLNGFSHVRITARINNEAIRIIVIN